MYWRMMSSKLSSGAGPSCGRAVGGRAGRPVGDDAGDALVALNAAPARAPRGPATASSASSICRTRTFRAGRFSAVRPPLAGRRGWLRRRRSAPAPSCRRRHRVRHVAAPPAARRADAGQRLADDAAEERLGRAIRPPGPHRDRHQPRRAAVDEALARVVGDQVLADQLLRAVEVCGVGSVSSATCPASGTAGSGPNTATELENTSRVGGAAGPAWRSASSSARVLSRLERMPRSKSASHSPRHRDGQVEHAVEVFVAQASRRSPSSGAGAALHACIVQQVGRRRRLVGQHDRARCGGRPAGRCCSSAAASRAPTKPAPPVINSFIVRSPSSPAACAPLQPGRRRSHRRQLAARCQHLLDVLARAVDQEQRCALGLAAVAGDHRVQHRAVQRQRRRRPVRTRRARSRTPCAAARPAPCSSARPCGCDRRAAGPGGTPGRA